MLFNPNIFKVYDLQKKIISVFHHGLLMIIFIPAQNYNILFEIECQSIYIHFLGGNHKSMSTVLTFNEA